MKTIIKVNGIYVGYIKPHGNGWKGYSNVQKFGRIFTQSSFAAAWVKATAI